LPDKIIRQGLPPRLLPPSFAVGEARPMALRFYIATLPFGFGRAVADHPGAKKRIPKYTRFKQKTTLQKRLKSRILATQFEHLK
jgi:hypothetical protein